MSSALATARKTPFSIMAERLNIDVAATQTLMKNTLMKAKGNGNNQVSDDELMTFLSIANEYKLNPLSKEIYAFNNRGAIQPIVSIDGWLKIINSHSQFNGMEFVDAANDSGDLVSVTCRIFRKDREHPTEVTEYMSECKGVTDPWKKWPARMLRHKATIQAARYAFGLSGIIDPDEAERYEQTNLAGEKVVNPEPTKAHEAAYPDDDFKANLPTWRKAILANKKTHKEIIAIVSTKGQLSEDQLMQINDIGVTE